ncbi:unnamed protein product [Peniophora sp. CBMAI 1063]|nr:unnamed protein product [Peniophora sp. CBMAI 1063]
MLFSTIVAVASAALVSATPTKRVDNREWIHLEVNGGYEGQDLCVGLPPIASGSYLGGAICGSSNATISDLTTLIALYGVGKSGPLRNSQYGCPTSTGVDLTGASDIPVVECDPEDLNQYFTIHDDGTVINDATGACLTMGKKAPSAPLTLDTCGGAVADLQQFTAVHITST